MYLFRFFSIFLIISMLTSGCIEFNRPPFSQNDFVKVEEKKLVKQWLNNIYQIDLNHPDIDKIVNDIKKSDKVVLLENMILVQKKESNKWTYYIIQKSDSHVFVCTPIGIQDYKFPNTIDIIKNNNSMGIIYTIDGPPSAISKIAKDLARTSGLACCAFPMKKSLKSNNIEKLTTDERFREYVIYNGKKIDQDLMGNCIASKSKTIPNKVKEIVLKYGLNQWKIKSETKIENRILTSLKNTIETCKKSVSKDQMVQKFINDAANILARKYLLDWEFKFLLHEIQFEIPNNINFAVTTYSDKELCYLVAFSEEGNNVFDYCLNCANGNISANEDDILRNIIFYSIDKAKMFVERCLVLGADPNQKFSNGKTLLQQASDNRLFDVSDQLIKYGANEK